ncbi:hypothetical protein LPJ75_001481, partial [Coemansia sp. RSA 2598]
SHPDTCVQWRLLADRRTLELRALRWVNDGQRDDREASVLTSWRFSSELLRNVAVADREDGAISIAACTTDGIVYRLQFASAWAIATTVDVGACTSWYRLLHSQDAALFDGVDYRSMLVACADSSVVWLNWRSDGSVVERVCSAGSAPILPRVAAFLMLRRGKSTSNDSEPVALDVTRSGDVVVGATLSRDRRLRLWSNDQCVFDETMPQVDTEGAAIPADPHAAAPLFDAGARAHVRIESVGSGNGVCALVYVPDDAVPYFALVIADIINDRVCNARTVMRKICRAINGASALMADDELVDVHLASQSSTAWTLWALWDRGQDTVVTYTHFSLAGEPIEFAGHDVFGERWFTTLQAPAFLRPTSDAPRIASIDARIRSEDTQLQAADISRVFLDHVLHPSRFDHGVVLHALRLYEQSARDRGFDVASNPAMPLRRCVASSVGCYLRAGSESRSAFLRQVYTEWMRYTTLCVRLQRAANAPVSLALCDPTRMVCVVGRNALSVLNCASESECLYALASKDHAASVLLGASFESIAATYPALARARADLPQVLAAAASIASALSPAALVPLTDDLARDACSGETLVSHQTRAVELFQTHCESLTSRQLRHITGLLRRCSDPIGAVRVIMHILEQSVSADAVSGNKDGEEEMFCASATMTGLLGSVFAAKSCARFELARNISLLLLVAAACPEQLPIKDITAALAAIQQIVGRFAVPQWLSAQATGANSSLDVDADRAHSLIDDSDVSSVDGFLRKFSVLNIERHKDPVEAADRALPSDTQFSYSLLHDTLARSYSLHFSGGSGVFSAMVADGVQQIFASVGGGAGEGANTADILFAASVERTQPPELADALLRQFPKSSALNYLTARAYLRLRDFSGASELFASAGIAYSQVADDLRDAVDLQYVLPENVIETAHAYAYYEHVAELFASLGDQAGVVRFSRLALQALDGDVEGLASDLVKETRQKLWFKIFYAEIERNSFEPAYMAVMAQPDKTVQLDCLRHLISVLCERDQGISVLCRLTFPGLQEEIERTLLFKARHSDLLVPRPNYYKILYSFHIYRGNYRNAASAMYQYARRLSTLMLTAGDVSELLVSQGQALLACISGLSLVDRQSAWVVVGRQSGDLVAEESADKNASIKHKRRRIAIGRYDTSAAAQQEAQDIDIVDLADIRREYALCMARVTLGTTFSELFARNLLFEPEDAVALYVKTCNYDGAFSLAKAFGLKLDGIFTALVQKGIQLSSISASRKIKDKSIPEAFWKNAGLPSTGQPSERIWGLLRSYLDVEEPAEGGGDLRYRLLVAQEILQAEYDSPLAPWLSAHLLRRCPQDLIRLCLVNGCVTEGAEFLLQHVNAVIARISSSETALSKNTREFWLPYQLIDQTNGILDDSVDRFEDAVQKIKEARGSSTGKAKGARLGCLLKSYRERLDGLKSLRKGLKSAFDRYMVLAARESQDINEAAVTGGSAAASKSSITVS